MLELPDRPATPPPPARRGLRVGTDLVEVSVIAEAVQRFGARYLTRVFTDAEVEYCESAPHECMARLAARFAAKEAVLKVLRPEGEWPSWRLIEVVRYPDGWCDIQLHGAAAALAEATGTRIVSCSLSHDGGYATAVALGLDAA